VYRAIAAIALGEEGRGPRPVALGVLAGVVIFGAACVSGATLYVRAAAALRDEVRFYLMQTAAAGAAMVDADLHGSLTEAAQEHTPAYEAAVAPLRRIQHTNSAISFMYTYALQPNGELRFVLDAAPAGDADGDGVDDKAHLMELYADTTTAMLDAIRTGRQTAEEVLQTDKWGTYLSAYAPIRDSAGAVVGAVGVDLDVAAYLGRLSRVRQAATAGIAIAMVLSVAAGILIFLTSRVAARAIARQAALLRELTSRNAELAEATSRAHDAARAKAAFLATMSHEIRTPMNGVLGMLGLVIDSDIAGKPREWTTTAFGSAKALLAILNDVLDYSKVEAGKFALDLMDFDVRAMLEDATALLAERAQAKGLELVCLVHPSVPGYLRGDPGRLRQIILNLGGNAIKFTSQGEVVIRAILESSTADAATVRFEVSDTGIGIPLEAQERLFQPFTQVDASTTRRYGGTGLGLSISRQLAELMGGTISLQSTEGAGSTFSFTARLQPAPAQDLPARSDLAGLRALVVDDNSASRMMFTDAIGKLGMEAVEAESGEDAIRLLGEAAARGERFDLALLDVVLPGMDGFEVARRITADSAFAGTRIVLVTAHGQPGHARQAQSAGGDAYLTKPVRQAELYACIAAVTARPGTAEAGTGSPSPLITRHVISAVNGRRRARVLLAEDHEVNQMLAVELLGRWGCRVDVVVNGAEAVRAVERTDYALVLMDCQMPVMDGFEATRAIRDAEPAGRHVPIVAMTANVMQGDRERCLAAGMDDYVSKPIDPETMHETIRRWLPGVQGNDAVPPPASDVPAEAPAAAPAAPPAPEGLDTGRLRTMVGNDPAKVRKYFNLFVSSAEPTIQALDVAVTARDAAGLRREAHKLKGSSANVGADCIAQVARELEQLPADEWDHARNLCTQLRESYTLTRAYAQTL
jgi:signal transduction histidine kinase/DNA-binding response OmpR family regulator